MLKTNKRPTCLYNKHQCKNYDNLCVSHRQPKWDGDGGRDLVRAADEACLSL